MKMSHIYATTREGERFLVYIECNRCDARIKPHADIAESGWTTAGQIETLPSGRTERFDWDYCPEHSR